VDKGIKIMQQKIKILLVDDHAVVRSGLTKILELDPAIFIAGEAKDGLEAIEKAQELQPDVILMDILMPRCTGLEAMVAIREKMPEARVLFLTVSDREEDLFKAIRFGAQGYLLKSASVDEVLEAVKSTAAGSAILTPSLAVHLLNEFRQKPAGENGLSEREMEVLVLVGEGFTNGEIARRLFIGETTVRTHLQRLLAKLHLRNRAGAIAYANRHHLLGNGH
jgi:DNA-binding NarL/FixJ family response regulator